MIEPSKKQITKAILTLKGMIKVHKKQPDEKPLRNAGGHPRGHKRDMYSAAAKLLQEDLDEK